MLSGQFLGLTAAELTTLRTNTLAALNGVLTGAQSYSLGGRTFTKADIRELRETLAEISHAQSLLDGTRTTRTYADMSRRY